MEADSGVIVQTGAGEDTIALRAGGPAAGGPISHLLVTTKAYDVGDALAGIAHRLTDGATIVLLVNGMGLAETVRAHYPAARLLCATTTEGAYRLGPRHIRYAGQGDTRVGGADAPPTWFDDFSRRVPRCRWDDDIDSALWDKLAVNCVINPLTALHHCNNGELARRPALRDAVETLVSEVAQVSYAAGFTRTAQTIGETAAAVIAATAANRSSMLQDIDRGRRTEIDYITGYLLRVADRYGIPAKHNAALYEEVKALDR